MSERTTATCYTDIHLGKRTACGKLASLQRGALVCEVGRPDRPVTCQRCKDALHGRPVVRASTVGTIDLRPMVQS